MKNKGVCKGCKYHTTARRESDNRCDYLAMTGRSRLLVEERNGGYKEDSCVCYESRKGKRLNREF